jgi:hypothetical protein
MNNKKCDGACEVHSGEVRKFHVYYKRNGKISTDWGFYHYCEAAKETDERRGLTVAPVTEEVEQK